MPCSISSLVQIGVEAHATLLFRLASLLLPGQIFLNLKLV